MNIVATIGEFDTGHDPQRLAMRYAKLRTSPFFFLRRTCRLFYDRLPAIGLGFRSPRLQRIRRRRVDATYDAAA